MPRCALCRMTTPRELLASLLILLLSAMHAQVSSQPLRLTIIHQQQGLSCLNCAPVPALMLSRHHA